MFSLKDLHFPSAIPEIETYIYSNARYLSPVWKFWLHFNLKSESCWKHTVNLVPGIFHASFKPSCWAVLIPWMPSLGGGFLLEESPWFLVLPFPSLLSQNWMLKWVFLEKSRPYMFLFKWWTEICAILECFVVFLVCILPASVLLFDLSFLCGCDHPCFLLSYQKMMTEPLRSLCWAVTHKCSHCDEFFPVRKCYQVLQWSFLSFFKKKHLMFYSAPSYHHLQHHMSHTCQKSHAGVLSYIKKIFLRWRDDFLTLGKLPPVTILFEIEGAPLITYC